MSSILNEKEARFQWLNLKVGLFITLALGIAALLMVGLAVRQGIFEAKTPISFVAPSGEGLSTGMAVKLSGFKIGEVSSISLDESAEVDVEMKIESRYMKWLRRDSVAVLSREGVIGDSYIAIQGGHRTASALAKDDIIGFRPSPTLSDVAADLRNRIIPVIGEMTTLLRFTNDPNGDLRQSIKHSKELMVEFRQTRKKLDDVLANLNNLERDELPGTLARTRTTLGEVDATLHRVQDEVPAVDSKLANTLHNVDQVLAHSNQTLGRVDDIAISAREAAKHADATILAAKPQVEQLLNDSRGLVNNANQAVTGMRSHWPFNAPEPAANSGH